MHWSSIWPVRPCERERCTARKAKPLPATLTYLPCGERPIASLRRFSAFTIEGHITHRTEMPHRPLTLRDTNHGAIIVLLEMIFLPRRTCDRKRKLFGEGFLGPFRPADADAMPRAVLR